MRACVIFNPSAKGNKAGKFRRHLDQIGAQSTLKLTSGPDDARRLATEAVNEGFDTIIAAGGDGTVHEVLNGLGDAPEGFSRARLAVLPLGTVNVFAKEMAIPSNLTAAWRTVSQGKETRIDLPRVEFQNRGRPQRRYFAQLGGAGLDARAIELVQWELKKKVGPLAYIFAGLQALAGPAAKITASGTNWTSSGGLVLIGNGQLYGGRYRIFPKADLRDGLLNVCVFPRVDWLTLARCGPSLLLRGLLPESVVETFQTDRLTLTSAGPTPFEADGELIGQLPASFSIDQFQLRVVVP